MLVTTRFISRSLVVFWLGCLSLFAQSALLSSAAPPLIEKHALENYLRYAEGFAAGIGVTIEDPRPSVFAGFYQVLVRLEAGKNKAVRTYYLTQDGQRLTSGPLFDLNKSPFVANLAALNEEGSPAFGPRNSLVTIYVFSDFECPYCREEARVLRQEIAKDYQNQVRVVFKNFPLEAMHPWAREAAAAGACIARQNTAAFWSFHDWIFEHQADIKAAGIREKILAFAQTQDLDIARLSACLREATVTRQVDKTIAEGRELGVAQTPTLFINGRSIGGALPAKQLNTFIELELEHSRQQNASP